MTQEQWLQDRKTGIGASDAAAVLGLNPWMSNHQLWLEKTGRVTPEDISNKPYVQYGINAEPHLRALFALDNPQYNVRHTPYKIIRHPTKPYIFATPDGELEEISTGRRGGLEIKTTEIIRSSDWDQWNERIPDHYYIQALHQMLAAQWDYVVLLAQIKYTARNGERQKITKQYLIERSDVQEDIDYVEEKVTYFWEYNVLQDVQPALILPAI